MEDVTVEIICGGKDCLKRLTSFFVIKWKHLSMRLLTTTMRSMTENLKFLTITMRAGGKLKPIWETAGGISLRLAEVWVEISGPGNQLLLSDNKNLQNYYFCEQSILINKKMEKKFSSINQTSFNIVTCEPNLLQISRDPQTVSFPLLEKSTGEYFRENLDWISNDIKMNDGWKYLNCRLKI